MAAALKILFVEDDPLIARASVKKLELFGQVDLCTNSKHALYKLDNKKFDVVITDMCMEEKLSGMSVIKKAFEQESFCVILSNQQSEDIVSQGYQQGCHDFISKPIDQKELELLFRKVAVFKKRHQSFEFIKKHYITKNQFTLKQLKKLTGLELSSKPVLLSGPTGTGKEVIAKCLAKILNQKIYSLNCGGLPTELFASEFFGHHKGAFTGAHENKEGLVKKAENGIIFLDEVHLLPMKAQQLLLRFIETGEYRPLGTNQVLKSNSRIVAAARENLINLVKTKEFKDDLYYRLNTFEVKLLALESRPEDIELQVNYFIKKIFGDKRKLVISKEAWVKILNHPFNQGNSREVMAMIENWFIEGLGYIQVQHLPFCRETRSNPKKKKDSKIESKKESKIEDKSEGLTVSQINALTSEGYEQFMKKISNQAKSYAIKSSPNLTQAAQLIKIAKSSISKFIKKERQLNSSGQA